MQQQSPTNQKEGQFYSNGSIDKICEKISNKNWKPKDYEGDAKIGFFEFQIILTRTAIEVSVRDTQLSVDQKKDIGKQLINFFENKLFLFGQPSRTDHDETYKHLQLLNKFHKQENGGFDSIEQLDQQKSLPINESLQQNQFEIIRQSNQAILSEPDPLMPMQDIISIIQNDFPQLPQFKSVEQIIQQNGLRFQKYMDDIKHDKEDGKHQSGKIIKKPTIKKDEPQREIIWEPINPVRQQDQYEHFVNFLNDIEFNTNHLQNFIDQPSLSHIQSAPVLIPEVLYPQMIPNDIQQSIESMLVYISQQNYYQAFQNLETAKQLWQKLIKSTELPDEIMIYFEYVSGQIYEIAGKDASAMNKFMKVKYHSEKLLINHPDRALPFCGFGSIFYHTQEYELALRAFLKAKEIRDITIGSENIENSVIYNNIGCCLHQLGHFYDAEISYQFGEALFDIHLGSFNSKTLTTKRNLQKLQKDRRFKSSI